MSIKSIIKHPAFRIWTIIHWKENDKISNYISVAFLVLVGLSLFGL